MKNIAKEKKGIVLVISLGFLVLFAAITVFYINTSISGFKLAKRMSDSIKAFYLAESGAQKALYELRKPGNYNWAGEGPLPINWSGSNKGEYEVAVTTDGTRRHVISAGYYPGKLGYLARRTIEVDIDYVYPSWFFNNAITAGENIDLKGNYTVSGNIMYGESVNPAGIGQKFEGPFPILDFLQIRNTAISQVKPDGQNNLYTAADIANGKPFPSSFWFDEDNGIPNVVYVETDLVLRGNVGTLGGFFVVAGDVITNESASADTTINGNGTIDGCVYTLGNFRINGGGNGLGVTGGVWGRDEVRLNGNATVSFNQNYMTAIKDKGISFKPQVVSWQEKF